MTGSTTRISKLGYGEIEQFLRDLTEEGFGGNHIRDFKDDKPAFRQWVQNGLAILEGQWTTLPACKPTRAWAEIDGTGIWVQHRGDFSFLGEDGALMATVWFSTVVGGHRSNDRPVSLHPVKWKTVLGVQVRQADGDCIEVRVPAQHGAQVTIDESDEWEPERGIKLCTGVLVSLGDGIEANIWGPSRPHKCFMTSDDDLLVVKLHGSRVLSDEPLCLHLHDGSWRNVGMNIQIRPDPSARNVIWVRNRKR